MKSYRKLNSEEIKVLEKNRNQADNWDNIQIKNGFNPHHIKNVTFSGKITLGIFDDNLKIAEGIWKKSCLENSFIKNCTIGDNVYISDVGNLSGYNIESNVVIRNVNELMVVGETFFGNETEIRVLNESGGRETIIYDRLSSQIAYFQTVYRHDREFIKKLRSIIIQYVKTKKSSMGQIKSGSRLKNTNKIINVNIGENCIISGAQKLKEGTLASSKEDPIFIGNGVMAKNFIVQSGSEIDSYAIIENSFIGQGIRINKQFTVDNSCFFANSDGFQGEACSLFAGPYTVTHHKSTLLIAGMVSFFNAGSGTNQSNHMYKLGPKHQGVLERGVKTGSFSYLPWPCRVGAFTTVLGKHYSNLDTTNLPFSYIFESNGKSILLPAMNLTTVGTNRDCRKWSERDRRKDPNKYDLINFNLFSPYTISKIISGIEILQQLKEKKESDKKFVKFKGIFIHTNALDKAQQKYNLALNIFIGNILINKINKLHNVNSFFDLVKKINPIKSDNNDKWLDISGMIVPKSKIEDLIKNIKDNNIKSIDEFQQLLKNMHDDYNTLSWEFCVTLIEKIYNTKFIDITKDIIITIIDRWKSDTKKFSEMILNDTKKEFSPKNRIGYGMDSGGDTEIRDNDFSEVFGNYDDNIFVKSVIEEMNEKSKKAEKIIFYIQSL